MKTLSDLMTEVPEHLVADAEVPVLSGPQRQGDVIVLPVGIAKAGLTEPAAIVEPEGIAVVRGENGGNTHLLIADGPVKWARSNAALDLGVLTVPDGATAYLLHPEHGASGIGCGSYIIRRQREQADEIRMVQD